MRTQTNQDPLYLEPPAVSAIQSMLRQSVKAPKQRFLKDTEMKKGNVCEEFAHDSFIAAAAKQIRRKNTR